MSFSLDLSAYVTVAERIAQFREKYPEGCLRPADLGKPWTVTAIGERTFICYVAAAYRNPGDPLPGIGVAWEPFPGRTPYTRDSELMNCETSAWGRAIVAVLAADTNNGIATAEEVRNRSEERAQPQPAQQPAASRAASRPAQPARAPRDVPRDVTEMARVIFAAKTVDELREAWKDAGGAGLLKSEVMDVASGEKISVQDLLHRRNDELAVRKSADGPAAPAAS